MIRSILNYEYQYVQLVIAEWLCIRHAQIKK